ncbi:uncharacterized protein CTRU02_202379 [Colletotrichum truncatum]|uniref:Uncharacterized protein n=1 Tax=Colletotrichum truncatum TaxID=5467 RepID=A0ACC3ZK39_COLTU|nr:uncharacterized protein CTRU02_01542 [Colletotrichum truncatum]KAF6799863.1 hypothetical protein CTRU02_01542 [Colletotrichum truncatum]
MDQPTNTISTPHLNVKGAITTSSKEPAEIQSNRLPHRKDSVTMFPNHQVSDSRSIPKRGRTTPVGNISLDTRVKPAWSVFTSPGSFEQLYNEKAYLTASLRGQGERTIELMRRLSIFQEKIDHSLSSEERRKARKKAYLLKSKITEATAQEKAITLRLCDIGSELSIRERWMRVQNETYERSHCWWPVDSAVTGYISSPSSLASVLSTPWDVSSPVLFPVGYYPVYNPLQMMPPCPSPEPYVMENPLVPESWVDIEMCEAPVDILGNYGLEFCLDSRKMPDCVSDEEAGGMDDTEGQNRKRRRRMSLPPLRCLWPGLQDM